MMRFIDLQGVDGPIALTFNLLARRWFRCIGWLHWLALGKYTWRQTPMYFWPTWTKFRVVYRYPLALEQTCTDIATYID